MKVLSQDRFHIFCCIECFTKFRSKFPDMMKMKPTDTLFEYENISDFNKESKHDKPIYNCFQCLMDFREEPN